DDGTYLSVSFVTSDRETAAENIAWGILGYVLTDPRSGILRKELLDRGIGSDVYTVYEDDMRQPVFSVTVQDAEAEQAEEFLKVTRETLERLVKDGIPKRSLQAAIKSTEFSVRESDFGTRPKGLVYITTMFKSWLYDDEAAFERLKYADTFAELYSWADCGGFEKLIKEKLLDNTHSVLVTLTPDPELAVRENEEESRKLKTLAESLSPDELNMIRSEYEALRAWQAEPDAPENIEKIPMISVSDIRRSAKPLLNRETDIAGLKALQHPVDTRGIIYTNLIFRADDFDEEELSYLSLLSLLTGNTDTQKRSCAELADEVLFHTGGIAARVSIYENAGPAFVISGKAMYEEAGSLYAFMREMLAETVFDDEARLRELIISTRINLNTGIKQLAHAAAIINASAQLFRSSYLDDLVSGIGFMRFLSRLEENFEAVKDEIREKLYAVREKLLAKERLLVDLTCDEEGFEKAKNAAARLQDVLKEAVEKVSPAGAGGSESRSFCSPKAFTISGNVAYNALAADLKAAGGTFTGALDVLSVILRTDYLWNSVRGRCGAYDAMCGFARNGSMYLASYRDPGIRETYKIFEETADYIETFDASPRDMTKYIIGAVSEKDKPLTPSLVGLRSLA
ncbi:MAG: insulinase family protein, partial [Lachnospiraceae bacterium]|nr:insulinase family protein [Lachnospiraceae bacterium]